MRGVIWRLTETRALVARKWYIRGGVIFSVCMIPSAFRTSGKIHAFSNDSHKTVLRNIINGTRENPT
jgi:hypothetical protein